MKKKISVRLGGIRHGGSLGRIYEELAKDDLSAMIQANVDALAEFEWNGQSWNENSDHWFGERWLPSLKECVTTNWLGKPFYGKQVVCEIGAGNCFNGTDCTNS